MWHRRLLVAEAAWRIRYNFGTAGGEISGERTCKRRSAKHLVVLPLLLEGRCSIQLSYGRVACSDSKTGTDSQHAFLGRIQRRCYTIRRRESGRPQSGIPQDETRPLRGGKFLQQRFAFAEPGPFIPLHVAWESPFLCEQLLCPLARLFAVTCKF